MGKTTRKKRLSLAAKIGAFLGKNWPLVLIFLLVVLFAFPYWAEKKVPFPADYLIDAFPPWQYYYGLPIKNIAMPDVVGQMYPWKHLLINLWKKGIVPLWNPFNFSGNPLLGNYQSAVFHPLNFLFFVLPEIDAWSLLILLQPLLAGFFTYLFVRQLKLSRAASLVSAIAFMFCGFVTVWMAYGTMAYALLWLPLILWGIERSFERPTIWSLVIISLALAASLFSGHFQVSLYVILFASAFLVFKLITTKKIKKFLICFLFVLLGCSLATVQILPTFELHRLSVRGKALGLSEVIPWSYWPTLIAPDFYGNPVTRNDWFGHYAEWSGFTGVIPLILAMLVIFKKRKPVVFYFAFLGLLSLVLRHPTFLLDWIVKLKVPVLSSSAAARINCLLSFSVAILAGFGFDQLRQDLAKKKLGAVLAVSSAVLILFAVVWGALLVRRPFRLGRNLIAQRNLILPTGMAVAFFGLLLAFWFVWQIFKNKKAWLRLCQFVVLSAVLLLIAFDLFRFAEKWMPFDSREHVYPPLPILTFLTKKIGADKPVDEAARLFGFIGMEMMNYYQIPGFDGYDPLFIQRYGELLMASRNGQIVSPSTRGVGLGRRTGHTERLLNLLGGKYFLHAVLDNQHVWEFNFWDYPGQFEKIYQDEKYEVYENKKALPRAFLAYDYQVIKEPQKIVDQILAPETDLRKTLILEEEPDKTLSPNRLLGDEGEDKVSIVKYSPNRVELEVQTEAPGLLFLSDNHYPGWKALIDGEETKIYRADYSFRAVAVPKGEYQVIFKYQPLSFRLGVIFSLFSLGAVFLISFLVHSKKLRV